MGNGHNSELLHIRRLKMTFPRPYGQCSLFPRGLGLGTPGFKPPILFTSWCVCWLKKKFTGESWMEGRVFPA